MPTIYLIPSARLERALEPYRKELGDPLRETAARVLSLKEGVNGVSCELMPAPTWQNNGSDLVIFIVGGISENAWTELCRELEKTWKVFRRTYLKNHKEIEEVGIFGARRIGPWYAIRE